MKHYVVKKESGSRYARVTHVKTGMVIKSFDVLGGDGDGWNAADRYCERLNRERDRIVEKQNGC